MNLGVERNLQERPLTKKHLTGRDFSRIVRDNVARVIFDPKEHSSELQRLADISDPHSGIPLRQYQITIGNNQSAEEQGKALLHSIAHIFYGDEDSGLVGTMGEIQIAIAKQEEDALRESDRFYEESPRIVNEALSKFRK